ncbi:hypothetical protein [Halorientalis halophila]|uniref:hypothetical protein n=1 Tax=Halorientalis halophila TaxID=3108499 RepID=UPI00300B8451
MPDDPETAAADDAPDADEHTADAADADDQPEIDDEEMADWGSVGDELDDDTGDDQDDEQDDADDAQEEGADGPSGLDPDGMQTSLGDVYCNALGMGAAISREKWGSLEGDRSEAMEDYADLARQLELDAYVDEWLKQQGGIDQLGPGQAALLMSLMFPVLVCMDDPDLAQNAMEGFDGF